jgi:hypothetical protein
VLDCISITGGNALFIAAFVHFTPTLCLVTAIATEANQDYLRVRINCIGSLTLSPCWYVLCCGV